MTPFMDSESESDPAAETLPAASRERARAEQRPGGESLAPVRLEIVGGPMDGITAHVLKDVLMIGRSPRSDLCLPLDPLVSASHARIARDGSGYWLEDLDSLNGTYVGEERIHDRTLIGPGTLFVLGSTCLEFTPASSARSL